MSTSKRSAGAPPAPKARLTVTTADPAAEIFVIDGQLNLVERDRGSLGRDLEPGLYKVKVRVGGVTEERHVALEPGGAVEVAFKHLAFASPVPLDQTAKTHEYHIDAAVRCGGAAPADVGRGSGSAIFVFARRFTNPWERRPDKVPAAPAHPARGLSLRDGAGAMVVDVSAPATSANNMADAAGNPSIDPWAACNVSVAPGPYRLRLDTPGGTLEQTVMASRGWQTQVFLTQKNYGAFGGAGPEERFANLPGASVMLARLGEGFHPESDQRRLEELARQALAKRRDPLPDQVVERILQGKFENPMLGLYGAHLLLMRKRPAVPKRQLQQDLDVIVRNLRELLGHDAAHPDVEALALLKGGSGRGQYRFETPPMLRRSWSLVLDASAGRPDIVPQGSPASTVGHRLWAEAPWLIWRSKRRPGSGVEVAGVNSADDDDADALAEYQSAVRRYVYPSLTRAAAATKATQVMTGVAKMATKPGRAGPKTRVGKPAPRKATGGTRPPDPRAGTQKVTAVSRLTPDPTPRGAKSGAKHKGGKVLRSSSNSPSSPASKRAETLRMRELVRASGLPWSGLEQIFGSL
jgi:hypothetical protein